MKFGKNLLREILQSNAEWAPFWLNYKNLKKRIKVVVNSVPSSHAKDISESALEVAFFRDLREELRKISVFFASEEKRYVARYQQLRYMLTEMEKKDTIDAFEAQRLMFACVHFYRECIRLENFAVINYQGFSKILKKHDKMTGYHTRTKYMRRRVNLSSFSHYPVLLKLLSDTEEMFREVDRDVRMAKAVSNMKLDLSQSKNSRSEEPSSSAPPPVARHPHSPKECQIPTPVNSSPMTSRRDPNLTCLKSDSSVSSSSSSSSSYGASSTVKFPASVLWTKDESQLVVTSEEEESSNATRSSASTASCQVQLHQPL